MFCEPRNKYEKYISFHEILITFRSLNNSFYINYKHLYIMTLTTRLVQLCFYYKSMS